MAPGGQTAFEDEDGKLYLVYHQRFAKTGEFHEPRVHQLFRTKDGWLVAAPFATDGETLKEDGYPRMKSRVLLSGKPWYGYFGQGT